MQTYRREAELTATRSGDNRTVELSFSSELPVDRGGFMEILSHDPGHMDLSRLNAGHPVLLNHDPDRLIGTIERAKIGSDKKGRATVRFGNSKLASEVYQDVKDGIRRLVSVGYRLVQEVGREVRDGIDHVKFAWQPYEISLVSVPADQTVGIGRNSNQILGHRLEVTTNNLMTAEQNRIEIEAIRRNLEGRVDGINELASRAILSGTSVEEFRRTALDRLPNVDPISHPAPFEFSAKDVRGYSIARAISRAAIGKDLDGLEGELSREVTKKTGKAPSGFWTPPAALMAGQRNFVQGTGTLGGMIVSTPNLGDEFIDLLRNKAQVLNLGARVLNLNNPVTIPRQNAAGAVNWVTETTAATLDSGNFTQVTLSPHRVIAFQQYSKQLLFTSDPSIDSLIRDDITRQLALAIDLAALHGSGSPQPTGIANTTGINTVALNSNGLALGNSTAYPFMVSLETEVAADNADMGSLAYLMRASHRASLKTQQRFASTDSPVYTAEVRGGQLVGVVNSYRAEISNQIQTNLTTGTATTICSAIFFGNWNDLLVGLFNGGAIDWTIDPYVLAVNSVTRIIASQWVDCAVRHPTAFCVGGGIL